MSQRIHAEKYHFRQKKNKNCKAREDRRDPAVGNLVATCYLFLVELWEGKIQCQRARSMENPNASHKCVTEERERERERTLIPDVSDNIFTRNRNGLVHILVS